MQIKLEVVFERNRIIDGIKNYSNYIFYGYTTSLRCLVHFNLLLFLLIFMLLYYYKVSMAKKFPNEK